MTFWWRQMNRSAGSSVREHFSGDWLEIGIHMGLIFCFIFECLSLTLAIINGAGVLNWRLVGQIWPADHSCLALCQLHIVQWFLFGPHTFIFELSLALYGLPEKLDENPYNRTRNRPSSSYESTIKLQNHEYLPPQSHSTYPCISPKYTKFTRWAYQMKGPLLLEIGVKVGF